MRRTLELHRDFSCPAVSRIEVEVARPRPGELALRYLVSGDIARLRLPPPSAPVRTDELWRHTCLEAFLAGPGDGYSEFNFAPSTQWAAYGFSGYRDGMRVLDEIAAPRIEVTRAADRFELRAQIDLGAFSPAGRLALSAVIEDRDGGKSYWALAHPPGKADFHHPDSFQCDLPPEWTS